MAASNLIFHYTTPDGAEAILKSGTLRATDVRYLNDLTELRYGSPALVEKLSAAAARLEVEILTGTAGQPEGPGASGPEVRLATIQELIQSASVPESELSAAPSVFVTSFCRTADLKSVWIAYASVDGYAIGFDREKLRRKLRPPQYVDPPTGNPYNQFMYSELMRVQYGPTAAKRGAEKAVLEWLPPTEGWIERLWTFNASRSFLGSLAGVKNPGFREELEMRLVLSPCKEPYTAGAPVVKEALSRDGLVNKPYVVARFPAEVVKVVWVGPGPNQAKRKSHMEQVLADNGYNAEVRVSAIPLRN